jgi:hybrid polyketide synthase/nonribosomal peptide synthetase ACE1
MLNEPQTPLEPVKSTTLEFKAAKCEKHDMAESDHDSRHSRTPAHDLDRSSIDFSPATHTEATATPSDRSGNGKISDSTNDMCKVKPQKKLLADMLNVRPKIHFMRTERMSFAQERLWFLRVYLKDSSTYNVTTSYGITGPLRIADLEKAFTAVIDRHESLRTAFIVDPVTHQPLQAVAPTGRLVLQKKRLESESDMSREFDAVNKYTYDLKHAEIMKSTLLSESPTSHVLILGFHHIAFDGFSSHIFIRDLAYAYNGQQLAPLRHQYIDFSIKQRMQKDSGMSKEIAYWKSEFRTLPPVLPLFDFARVRSRKSLTEYKIRTFERTLSVRATAGLRSASQRLGATPFHFHLAALQVLLHRFLKISDLCIGVIDANKKDPEHYETLGFFVNLLALRFQIDSSHSFANVVQNTRDRVLLALEHSQLPFDALLDELNAPRSTDHNPLFQVILNYKMGSAKTVALGNCQAELLRLDDAGNPYDLAFEIETATDGTTLVAIKCQEYLYSEDDLGLLFGTYSRLLEEFAQNASLQICQYPLFEASDAQAAVQLGKGARVDLDETFTISRRFEEIALNHKSELAVSDDLGNTLTYAEMVALVHSISTSLVQSGVRSSSFVAVYCEPTVHIICYLLGIIRINAVYVPLDAQIPAERLQLVVDDCRPSVIICDSSTISRAHDMATHEARIVDVTAFQIAENRSHVDDISDSKSPACAIYTSGSTGIPKGVLLTQSSLANNVVGIKKRYSIGQEVILQQTSLGFDLSLAQMLQFLVSGGRLVVASKTTRVDPVRLAKLIAQEGVTYTWATPSEYSHLLRYGIEYLSSCSRWLYAFSAGEAMTDRLVSSFEKLALPNLRLYDAYGPSEATICASAGEIELGAKRDILTIGTAMPNYSIYILDDDLQPIPAGLVGEIVIGGSGVAIGYLGKDNLTSEKFVADTFASTGDISKGWNKMYRTGDRGKLLADGRIIYLGRVSDDSQVKIRGVRIELDDIANTIMRHASRQVVEAAVCVRGEGEEKFPVAFIVLSAMFEDPAAYLAKLKTALPLPPTMLPSKLVPIDFLPITKNGKLDRAALQIMPLPNQTNHADEEVTLTPTEEALREIWICILPPAILPTAISKTADFFDIGGNSLLLVRLQANIREVLGVDVPLFELFAASALQQMAAKVVAMSSAVQSPAAIDWDTETSMDIPLQGDATEEQKPVSDKNIEVLLTGSTGFLGSGILEVLIEDPNIRRIHCVALRDNGPNHASHKLSRSEVSDAKNKIVQYSGDLSAPLLGLDDLTFTHLSSIIDRIIHNGADVSFSKPYLALRGTNVDSTKTLIRLALPRRIPFHFISTAGVAQFLPPSEKTLAETSLSACPPPARTTAVADTEGYITSKWVCESLLEHIATQHRLPVWIHRPCNILGTGAQDTNLMASFVAYAVEIRAVPRIPLRMDGAIEFVALEGVSREIVDMLACASGVGREERLRRQHNDNDDASIVRFVNHCGDVIIPVSQLGSSLEQEFECQLEQLELDEWLGRARAAGLPAMFATMMGEILKKAEAEGLVLKTLTRERRNIISR